MQESTTHVPVPKMKYRMVERDPKEISYLWKFSHMLTLSIVFVSSLVTIIHFDDILSAFGKRCVLYANLKFSTELKYYSEGDFPHNLSFHNPYTIWGNQKTCAFSRGTLLISMVIAMIFWGFFAMVPRGGAAYKNLNFVFAWKLIFPAFFLTFLITIFVFIAYFTIIGGLNQFCSQFPNGTRSCDDEVDVYTLIFNKEKQLVSSHILTVKLSLITVIVSWSIHAASLFVRLMVGPDFKIETYFLYRIPSSHNQRLSTSITPEYQEETVKPPLVL